MPHMKYYFQNKKLGKASLVSGAVFTQSSKLKLTSRRWMVAATYKISRRVSTHHGHDWKPWWGAPQWQGISSPLSALARATRSRPSARGERPSPWHPTSTKDFHEDKDFTSFLTSHAMTPTYSVGKSLDLASKPRQSRPRTLLALDRAFTSAAPSRGRRLKKRRKN